MVVHRDEEALPEERGPSAERSDGAAQSVCPHLALRRDPATSARYPRPDHICRAGRKPAAVQIEHQATYCTGGAYPDCPVFRGETERPPAPPRSVGQFLAWREISPLRAAAMAVFVVVIPAAIATVVAVSRDGDDASPGPRSDVTSTEAPARVAAAAVPEPEGASPAAAAPEAPGDPLPEPAAASIAPVSGDPVEQLLAWAAIEEYVVEEGNALGAIATDFDTTPEAIARLNGIADPASIQVGQRLVIPVGFRLELPAPESANEGPDTSLAPVELTEEALALLQSWDNVVVWQVVEGDTLSGLATEFGTSVEAIVALNGLSSSRLAVGDVLQIPVGFQIPPPPEGGPVDEAPPPPEQPSGNGSAGDDTGGETTTPPAEGTPDQGGGESPPP